MFAVLSLVFIAAPTENAAMAKEMQKLQGSWQVVSVETEGKKMPADKFGIEKIVFDTKAPKNAVRDGQVLNYTLDVAKSPKTIDAAAAADGPKKFALVGIYQLEDDKLKLCLAESGADRPKEFATKANIKTILLELKREKK